MQYLPRFVAIRVKDTAVPGMWPEADMARYESSTCHFLVSTSVEQLYKNGEALKDEANASLTTRLPIPLETPGLFPGKSAAFHVTLGEICRWKRKEEAHIIEVNTIEEMIRELENTRRTEEAEYSEEKPRGESGLHDAPCEHIPQFG